MNDDNDSIFGPSSPRSPQQRQQEFIEGLAALRLTPGDLATKLVKFGDDRPFTAIIRSIERMISGETKVSAEMSVILSMLLRQNLRLKKRHGQISWASMDNGSYHAKVDGWYVYISPQTRGRWLLSCAVGPSRQDYSPQFGRWLDCLDEVKSKALVEVEEGMNNLAEIEHENQILQSQNLKQN